MSMLSVMCERLRNIADNLSANGYTDTVRELRDAADVIDDLRRKCQDVQLENAKLRELVRDMWRDVPKTESCGWNSSANTCTGSDECHGECALWHRMHELGIEV
jgi:hypothetical protein